MCYHDFQPCIRGFGGCPVRFRGRCRVLNGGLLDWQLQPALLNSVRHHRAIGYIVCFSGKYKVRHVAADVNRLLDHSQPERLWGSNMDYVSVLSLLSLNCTRWTCTLLPGSLGEHGAVKRIAVVWNDGCHGSRAFDGLFCVERHSIVPEDPDALACS